MYSFVCRSTAERVRSTEGGGVRRRLSGWRLLSSVRPFSASYFFHFCSSFSKLNRVVMFRRKHVVCDNTRLSSCCRCCGTVAELKETRNGVLSSLTSSGLERRESALRKEFVNEVFPPCTSVISVPSAEPIIDAAAVEITLGIRAKLS